MVRTPAWPGAVAHARGGVIELIEPELHAVDEPVDLRCSGCKANYEVRFDVLDPEKAGIVAFIAHHDPRCQALADRLELKRRVRP